MPLTKDQLADLRRMEAEATRPLPFRVRSFNGESYIEDACGVALWNEAGALDNDAIEDSRFLVALRNAAADLIEAAEEYDQIADKLGRQASMTMKVYIENKELKADRDRMAKELELERQVSEETRVLAGEEIALATASSDRWRDAMAKFPCSSPPCHAAWHDCSDDTDGAICGIPSHVCGECDSCQARKAIGGEK